MVTFEIKVSKVKTSFRRKDKFKFLFIVHLLCRGVSKTPIYNSAYIEGIHNLYEFDCGSLSGWENLYNRCTTSIVEGYNSTYGLQVTTPNAWDMVRQKVNASVKVKILGQRTWH